MKRNIAVFWTLACASLACKPELLRSTADVIAASGSGSDSSSTSTTGFTETIPFTSSSDYTVASTAEITSGGMAALKAQDLTDDDNSATGFAGGTHALTQWTSSALTNQDGNRWTLPVPADTSPWTSTTSVLAVYRFEETAYANAANEVVDSSGAARHGTTVNAVASVATGKFGRGGQPNGTSSYFSLPAGANGLTVGSVEFWFKPTWNGNDGVAHEIWSRGRGTPPGTILALSKTAANNYELASFCTGGVENYAIDATDIFRSGQWTHLALTYDLGAGTAQIYANGINLGGGAIGDVCAILQATGPHNLGAGDFAGFSNYAGGVFDEFASWSRILTPTEIEAHYSRQAPAHSGRYTSRVMDLGGAVGWNRLAWTPTKPYGKPMPASGATETAYSSANVAMTSNLALFRFEESAYASVAGEVIDSSSVANPGRGYNGATTTAAGGGRIGRALALDGINDYVEAPAHASYTTSGALTFMAWIRQRKSTTMQIIAEFNNAGTVGANLSLGSDGTLAANFVDTGSTSHIVGGTAPATVLAGQWTHVAGVYDGANSFVYVNGVTVATATPGAFTPRTAGKLQIGSRNTGSNFFKGWIDEVAVFNRALSQTEVAAVYARGAMRTNYQVRTCDDAVCDTETWIGSDGTANTSFTELSNTSTGLPDLSISGLTTNRYFQYRVDLESDITTEKPTVPKVVAGLASGTGYWQQTSAVEAVTGIEFKTLSGFTETLGAASSGTLKYQLSLDRSKWYSLSGSTWTESTSASQASTATEINAAISTFSASAGASSTSSNKLYVRAQLTATSAALTPLLDLISITGKR